jgi:hypothetical protein
LLSTEPANKSIKLFQQKTRDPKKPIFSSFSAYQFEKKKKNKVLEKWNKVSHYREWLH